MMAAVWLISSENFVAKSNVGCYRFDEVGVVWNDVEHAPGVFGGVDVGVGVGVGVDINACRLLNFKKRIMTLKLFFGCLVASCSTTSAFNSVLLSRG